MSDLGINNQKTVSNLFNKEGTSYKIFGDRPPTLIFIHGVGMCNEIWAPQVEYFSKKYQVITYDFLGHGQSPLPKNEPTLDDYVEQLNNLVDSIGVSNFSLVGHSMGAIISVAFARKFPLKVNALVALNIVFNRSEKAQKDVLLRANQVLESNKILNIEKTLERWFKNNISSAEMNKIDKVRNWLKNTSPKGYGEAYRLFALSDKVFVNNLYQLKLPILYLTGNKDPNSTPLMSEQISQETPNSSSKSVDGEAHMMSYIAANKVNPIIEQFFTDITKKTE
ncbi:MAG: alpha/beta fold hydrolase [Candidatus Pseudothioglobus sp.]